MTRETQRLIRRDRIAKMHADGLTNAEMAVQVGLHQSAIAGYLLKLGLAENAPAKPARQGVVTAFIASPSVSDGDRKVSISLPALPFEIAPDARHETAPRHRGLIGGHVDRGQGYEDEVTA